MQKPCPVWTRNDQIRYSISDLNVSKKTIPSQAGHTYTHIREYPSLVGQSYRKVSQVNTFRSGGMCRKLELIYGSSFSTIQFQYYIPPRRKTQALATERITKQCISTNPPHPGTSYTQDIKTRASLRLDVFPETKHYFFQRNSFLLELISGGGRTTNGIL